VPPFERFTIPHKQELLESLSDAKDKVVLLIGSKSKEFLHVIMLYEGERH
jgi:hypothetical protein